MEKWTGSEGRLFPPVFVLWCVERTEINQRLFSSLDFLLRKMHLVSAVTSQDSLP